MQISYSYRGNQVLVTSNFTSATLNQNGTVSFRQNVWSDGNMKVHEFRLEASELLPTAISLLKQLSKISGIEYKACTILGSEARYF